MTDDFEDPANDIPDEPPVGAPTTVPDPEFPDEDSLDAQEDELGKEGVPLLPEDDATTTPEDPQT